MAIMPQFALVRLLVMMKVMKIKSKNIKWGKYIVASTEFVVENPRADIVMFHGAGAVGQERMLPIAKELGLLGYNVVTFDFISHGQSSGRLEELNLEKRQAQAIFMIDSFNISKRTTIIGFSMGGQTAIDVANSRGDIENLILIAPAVYNKAAREAYFGQNSEFSHLIRQPNSWLHSDAWNKLATFKGNLMVIQAENDEVIPEKIPELLYASADNALFRVHILLKNLPHALAKFTVQNPSAATWFAKIISQFIENSDTKISNQTIQFETISKSHPE